MMPKEKQFKWAWGYYEMRYVYFPDELAGYNPTWINREFLEKATFENGNLKIGNALYHVLYIDVEYLDYRTLVRTAELAEAGLAIVLKRDPEEPGMTKHPEYNEIKMEIRNSKFVTNDIPADIKPFITGDIIPRHWCRIDGETLYIFFPNPRADRIKFPMEYGQSLNMETEQIKININFQGNQIDLNLAFEPYQSLLFKITNSMVQELDISFIPKAPVVKERPEGYKAPWLVGE